MAESLARLLERLEAARHRFGPGEGARAVKLLDALGTRRFADAATLVRFHEALLFLRAYPQTRAIARRCDELLGSFAQRVARLRTAGADLAPFEEPEVSGIAGTAFSAVFSYDVARELVQLLPASVDVDWDGYETERLARCWRHLLPLLEEDSLVEANVPYLEWLRRAKADATHDLAWILKGLERLPLTPKERKDLYDSLELPLRLEVGNGRASRTRMRLPVARWYCHDRPLLRRSDVRLAEELASPPLAVRKLTRARGEAFLAMARETSAMRFRELYGFTYGDPAHVLKAEAGRGVALFLCGLPPERRLPLRAYHAGMIFKNGVPAGYVETLTLFERMEVGFNIYYTFREGESAWLYARLLRLFRQLLGVSCFSVDPYQVGHHNEEAIESGAFWFYRKLGFRPTAPEPVRLLEREEKKLAATAGYRTPAATLRRLAAGYMIYEIPGSASGGWDRFLVRNLGLAVQRRMARCFDGDAAKMRCASATAVARILGVDLETWKEGPRRAFEDLALVLALIANHDCWTEQEKARLAGILRAKTAPEESEYVRRLQAHARLRDAIIKLGSTPGLASAARAAEAAR